MLRGPITDLNEDKLLDLFHTNVISGMMLTGLAVPHLEKSQGAIIFIGSIHTRRAFPERHLMQQLRVLLNLSQEF